MSSWESTFPSRSSITSPANDRAPYYEGPEESGESLGRKRHGHKRRRIEPPLTGPLAQRLVFDGTHTFPCRLVPSNEAQSFENGDFSIGNVPAYAENSAFLCGPSMEGKWVGPLCTGGCLERLFIQSS